MKLTGVKGNVEKVQDFRQKQPGEKISAGEVVEEIKGPPDDDEEF